ncbi:MAG: hypothetical protein HKP25_11610 [Marinicaulis sp.]|nr:hypothetical protein [Marinicaulis sp.]
MKPAGLIINALSNRNAKTADGLKQVAARHEGVLIAALEGIEGLGLALDHFSDAGVDTVIIAGGDGTVQAAFTDAINNNRFGNLPKFAVFPCGMTNVIANDCGVKGDPVKSLEEFLARRADGLLREQKRSILSVRRGNAAPIHGFFFGAGAFHSAVLYSRRKIHKTGAKRGLAFVASIASSLWKAVRDPDEIIEPVEVEFIDMDGAPKPKTEKQTVLLATTLKALGSGAYPFWGEGAGELATTAVDYPYKRLLRAMPNLLRGKSAPWFDDYGYRSWRSGKLTVRFSDKFILDGEIFDANGNEDIHLETRHAITFVN